MSYAFVKASVFILHPFRYEVFKQVVKHFQTNFCFEEHFQKLIFPIMAALYLDIFALFKVCLYKFPLLIPKHIFSHPIFKSLQKRYYFSN